MRIACVRSWSTVDVVVKNKVWGAARNRVRSWQTGERFVLLVGREGVVVATVSGTPFESEVMLWPDDLYPYRVPITVDRVARGTEGKQLNACIRTALTSGYGSGYGWVLLTQCKVPEAVEKSVATVL